MTGSLDERLLAAHERSDLESLTTLYSEAAEAAEDLEARCFYLTHAYVFALEIGDDRAKELRARLVGYGREE